MIRTWVKNSTILHKTLTIVLFIYLKIVYITSKWHYHLQHEASHAHLQNLMHEPGNIWVTWHNKLALLSDFFAQVNAGHALVSSHKDGKIISRILRLLNVGIIEGSTNRGAFSAIKSILAKLQNGSNIAITPDGPRGPKEKINSNVFGIAKLSKAKIIPISATVSKYIKLNSWDELEIPLPFSRFDIYAAEPLIISRDADEEELKITLENILKNLSQK